MPTLADDPETTVSGPESVRKPPPNGDKVSSVLCAEGLPMTMDRGVVVRYDADKGFGFVRSRAYGDGDVFVHASTIVGGLPLHPGQRVRFLAEPSLTVTRSTAGFTGMIHSF